METTILKERHGNLTMNITMNNNPWYLREPNQQNSFCSEPGTDIVLYTFCSEPGTNIVLYTKCTSGEKGLGVSGWISWTFQSIVYNNAATCLRGRLYEKNWFTSRPYQKSDCSFTWLGETVNSSIDKILSYLGVVHLSEP